MLRSFLFSLLLLAASGARGQAPGACELGTAQGDLDISNVFARVFNTGSLFYGNSTTRNDGYVVPRIPGHSPLFAAGLWLGGLVDGELRVAGGRYTNFTFWPGPLNDDGTLPDADNCSAFDRIYVVSVADVDRYEASGEASADLTEWPVGLGAPAVDASGEPLAATSRDQTLDLARGERPVIYGSQTAWWVMNDVGGPHTAQETPPLGVEVRVSAFAISGGSVLGTPEATFYRYEIVNRGPSTIEAMHAGFFVDPDLGDAGDDFVGSDSTRGMGFVYNGNDPDAVYGVPPALGFDILSGAGAVSYFENLGRPGPTTDPSSGEGIYNFMQGLWGDGTPMRESENGYNQPATFSSTRYAFPGDPVLAQHWSEVNTGCRPSPGDRRFAVSSPAYTLASGETRVIDLGILFAQGAYSLNSITELRAASDAVQAAYDDGSLFSLGSELATLAAPSLLSPEASQYVGPVDSVAFAWAPVEGAERYALKWGPSVDSLTSQRATTQISVSVDVLQLSSRAGLQTIYWSVEAFASGAVSLPSEVRAGQVFVGGPLILASGAPAYVEVANSAGTDPCAPEAESRDGCDEVGGNLIWRSFNSDGSYYFSEAPGATDRASTLTLGAFAPNDFEIRFTEEGGLAAYLFQPPWSVVRVPFEIWDVGSVLPGETNDPSDDVRLIPYLFADNGGTCAFDAAEIPDGDATLPGYVESDRIYAYYPASSYADFEGDFLAEVEAAPNGCAQTGSQAAVTAYLRGSRPVQRQVFGSLATAPALPAIGTVIRMYTTGDPPPVAATPSPEASGGIALIIAPNPTRGVATVRLTLASPEAVRVRVLDMLGREVAVLAEGPQASGEAVFKLPGDLASGVYAVEASAGEKRATRLLTIVR